MARFRLKRVEGGASEAASSTAPPPAAGSGAPPATPAFQRSAEQSGYPPDAAEHESAQPTLTGGWFPSATHALSFLSAVASGGYADTAEARRGPKGACWVQVAVAPTIASTLALIAGGVPFCSTRSQSAAWFACHADGSVLPGTAPTQVPSDPTLVTGDDVQVLSAQAWPEIGLQELLVSSALVPTRLRPEPRVSAFVPSELARWVLERALRLGLEVELTLARREPLHVTRRNAGEAGVWMTMSAAGRNVSSAWLSALVDLPGVIVAYAAGGQDSHLWVDVRYRASVSTALFGVLANEDEIWLLGGPEEGYFRVELRGKPSPGSGFLLAPAAEQIGSQARAGEARLPEPIPVHLVALPPRLSHAGTTDAVLLDDSELLWLRDYLMTRPWGERAYILPGAGRHLLFAQGELLEHVPFGTALRRVGPGALYVERGADFSPPLPDAARRHAFQVDDQSAVVVTLAGSFRLLASDLTPAWTLWVGRAPQPNGSSTTPQAQALGRVLAELELSFAPVEGKSNQREAPVIHSARDEGERQRLRDAAMMDQLRGDLVAAAEKLERAGDAGAAGRLYERAARASRPSGFRTNRQTRERGPT